MQIASLLKPACVLGFSMACGALLLFGCATSPKVDWNSRVGLYTYDQAVTELGVPDKIATLSDGGTVAEWISHRGGGSALSFGVGSFGPHTGVGVSQTVGAGGRIHGLRLTFDKEGKLAAWLRN